MYIPEEILPKVTDGRLPSTVGERWLGESEAATKAEHYFNEGLQKLALAKYWAERAERDELQ
jgi:hypothetical protein